MSQYILILSMHSMYVMISHIEENEGDAIKSYVRSEIMYPNLSLWICNI